MDMAINVKINERQTLTASVNNQTLENCMRGLNALLAYDGHCGQCGDGTNITLEFKEIKGYTFTEFVCHSCKARAQWGQFKAGGYFLKKWEVYKGENQSAPEPQGYSPQDTSPTQPDDKGF